MTVADPAPVAAVEAEPPTVLERSLDGFRSLNPADGLFLRAEHLAAIQTYARDLAQAAARGTGPGVVHGFGVTTSADGASLAVSPGVAVTPRGRLLKSQSTIVVPLDDDHLGTLGPNGFWRVELVPASEATGSAPVYGSLCADACSDQGRAIHVWLDEGVAVQLTPDSLDGLDGVDPDQRRSWLASAYFERERAAGPPWLVPAGAGLGVAPLYGRLWDDATALPPESGVPLAVLQPAKEGHQLDVWTARRLVDGAAAQATWRSRLALRPWSVFLAQVLQFESQLADSGAGLLTGDKAGDVVVLDVEIEDDLRDDVAKFLRRIEGHDIAKRSYVKALAEAARAADAEGPSMGKALTTRSLAGRGFVEIPPAGYLAVDQSSKKLAASLRQFFGEGVDLRLCAVRADQVAPAVVAAQHGDRIPLTPGERRAQVDVLVPEVPADKVELYADRYGWVAYVRRPASCTGEEASEPVGVYVAEVKYNAEVPWETYEDGETHSAEQLGALAYPQDGWAFPGGEVAEKLAERTDLRQVQVHVVALATSTARAPLATLRAALFLDEVPDATLSPPVHTYVTREDREAIIVVLQELG